MKRKTLTKGEPGYIAYKKKVELLFSVTLFLIAAGLFILGLALNNWEKGNIFTIIAALFIIPMARFLTQFILLFPFKSVSEEELNEVTKTAKPGSIIYADNVIASTEKAMQLSFIVITSNKLLCYTGREKEDASKVQGYLNDLMTRRGHDWRATVTGDKAKFLSLLRNSDTASGQQPASDGESDRLESEMTAMRKELESVMI